MSDDRYIRYRGNDSGTDRYGILRGEQVVELSGAPWFAIEPTGSETTLGAVELLPPVDPGKIVCIGLN